jgi:hypothetical protein
VPIEVARALAGMFQAMSARGEFARVDADPIVADRQENGVMGVQEHDVNPLRASVPSAVGQGFLKNAK